MKKRILLDEVRRAEDALRAACNTVVATLDVTDPQNWRQTVSHAVKAGLQVRDIADACSCAISTVTRWQEGSSVPSLVARRWIKIELCRMLGVEPAPEVEVTARSKRRTKTPRPAPEVEHAEESR